MFPTIVLMAIIPKSFFFVLPKAVVNTSGVCVNDDGATSRDQ